MQIYTSTYTSLPTHPPTHAHMHTPIHARTPHILSAENAICSPRSGKFPNQPNFHNSLVGGVSKINYLASQFSVPKVEKNKYKLSTEALNGQMTVARVCSKLQRILISGVLKTWKVLQFYSSKCQDIPEPITET